MMKNFFDSPYKVTTIFVAILSLLSCNTTQKMNYFNDLPDAEVINLPPLVQEERVVEKGDNLQISISARSSEAASFFNRGAGSAPTQTVPNAEATASPAPSSNTAPYLVDVNGIIEFPIIGKIQAAGLTALQLKANLTRALTPYLKDPLVDVLFTSFNVSFIGEVRSPGTKLLSMQRTTLLEGLAAAGDLSQAGKRFDIHLYRDYKGERKIYKFDLRKKDILNNRDIFQLRHNDVIYVQTRPGVATRENIGIYTSLLSIVIGLTTLGITLSRNN